jgi:hypothetical protein
MTAKRRKRAQDDWRECPTAWFSMLAMALQSRDYARAAAAQKELKRLKVEVRFLELPAVSDVQPGADDAEPKSKRKRT